MIHLLALAIFCIWLSIFCGLTVWSCRVIINDMIARGVLAKGPKWPEGK